MIGFILSVIVMIYYIVALYHTLFVRPKYYWKGPKPSEEQVQIAQQIISEHFEKYPQSGMQKDFPYLHSVAMATNYYREINEMLESGQINQQQYDEALEKVLPYIKI